MVFHRFERKFAGLMHRIRVGAFKRRYDAILRSELEKKILKSFPPGKRSWIYVDSHGSARLILNLVVSVVKLPFPSLIKKYGTPISPFTFWFATNIGCLLLVVNSTFLHCIIRCMHLGNLHVYLCRCRFFFDLFFALYAIRSLESHARSRLLLTLTLSGLFWLWVTVLAVAV